MAHPLKIFHCGDLHLGLQFAKYPEEVAKKLREARLETLARLVDQANRASCDLFVVAGDLFDHLQVAKKDVVEAARVLSAFGKVTAVLPGNHDFLTGQENDLWKTKFPLPDHGRLLLLDECRPYPLQDLGLDAVLYPAPCHSKYSVTHGLGWLETAERPPAAYHVGIAHGSFEGLSPDLQGNYYPMKRADLLRCQLDLWLLGHIHVQYPLRPGAGDRIFYSGTHEPDGFDCRHEGKAWLIEIDQEKRVRAESLSTGRFRFYQEELVLRSLAEMEAFSRRFTNAEAGNSLLKLTLQGALRRDEHSRFAAALEALKARFLFLKADFTAVGVELAPEDIDREFARASFPHRLLSELAQEVEGREALQAAFELLQHSRRGE